MSVHRSREMQRFVRIADCFTRRLQRCFCPCGLYRSLRHPDLPIVQCREGTYKVSRQSTLREHTGSRVFPELLLCVLTPNGFFHCVQRAIGSCRRRGATLSRWTGVVDFVFPSGSRLQTSSRPQGSGAFPLDTKMLSPAPVFGATVFVLTFP